MPVSSLKLERYKRLVSVIRKLQLTRMTDAEFFAAVAAVAEGAIVIAEEAEEARALLRDVEWSSMRFRVAMSQPSCPVCGGWKDEGHAPDCRLAALLG